jgi:hypothetical protein
MFSSSAILFECVHTVYSIYPKSELLEKAAKCIGKFVLSSKINLKYLGKIIGSLGGNYIESF